MKQKSMFFWNSFAFSMIQQRWQFDLWYLCLFITQLVPLEDLVHVLKVCLVKAVVFPVVLYGCESCTIKKAEHQRINAFELWCWRRLLRFTWTARRSNQSILKEISPGISVEGMMLKLKLQYFGYSCEELTHWKRL